MKKLVALGVAAALLAAQGVAAATATDRAASPIKESEGVIAPAVLVALFAAITVGVVAAVESGESDTPTSP